jgi:hypothetical protein
MDILAHSLWAGVGLAVAARHMPISRRTAVATVALAVLPDIVQLVPLLPWVTSGDGSYAALRDFVIATPGAEPGLPPPVALLSHHLHCTLHSAVLATALTLLLWGLLRRFWIPLAGWWSHIVIDFFTHSRDFYAVPVLYPFSDWGFDGLAWNTPWFLALNYTVLITCIAALALTRRR